MIYIILFIFVFVSLGKSQDKPTVDDFRRMYLRYYYNDANIKIDSTLYTPAQKEKIITTLYNENDFVSLSGLFFYKQDTIMNRSIINKWINGIFNEQHYPIILANFSEFYPNNYHVAMSRYKSKQYKTFITSLAHIKKRNLILHLAKLDALFRIKEYNAIVNDSLYINQKNIPLQVSELHIKANYKLKNYNNVIRFFKTLSNDQLTPEIIFIGAQAYLKLKQYDISNYFFNLYINNFNKTDMQEFQLAHYYQGLSHQEQNRMKEAESYYEKAISFNPNYTNLKAFVHQTLGGYYQDKKMYQKSLDQWIQYLALLPEKSSKREETQVRIEKLREKAFFNKSPSKKN